MEEWRRVSIDGGKFSEWYDVSDLGRVRSRKRKEKTIVLRPAMNDRGYFIVSLSAYGKQRTKTVHALVADAFIGEKPKGMQVNHIDGDKQNNAPSNLEYVYPHENMNHYRNGNKNQLPDEVAYDAFRRIANGEKAADVAKEAGVGKMAISHIIAGKNRPYLREKWIAEGNEPLEVEYLKRKPRKFSDTRLMDIFRMRDAGVSFKTINRAIGCSDSYASFVYHGRLRPYLREKWLKGEEA